MEQNCRIVQHGFPYYYDIVSISPFDYNLLYLMLKFMQVEACETILDLAERMKLPRRVLQRLVESRSRSG